MMRFTISFDMLKREGLLGTLKGCSHGNDLFLKGKRLNEGGGEHLI